MPISTENQNIAIGITSAVIGSICGYLGIKKIMSKRLFLQNKKKIRSGSGSCVFAKL